MLASSAQDALRRQFDEKHGFEEYYRNLYREGEPAWAENRAHLEELIQLCRERGIELLILLIPELHSPTENYPFEEIHDRIEGIAGRHGVRAIEVRAAMAGIEPRSLWVSPGDAHPNAQAHRIIGEQLFAVVSEFAPESRPWSPLGELRSLPRGAVPQPWWHRPNPRRSESS